MLSAISTNEVAGGGALAQANVELFDESYGRFRSSFEQPVMFANAFQKQKLSSIYSSALSLAPRDRNMVE